MNHLSTSIAVLAATLAMTATAVAQQQPEHRLVDHPAVIVKRNAAQRPVDYASTFYPHPAWLWLASEAPAEAMGSPIVASNDRARRNAPMAPVLSSTAATSAR